MFKRIFSLVVLGCFIFTASMPAALATTKQENEQLTLYAAVQKALERSSSLEIQDLKIDKAAEEMDDMRRAIKHIPGTGFFIPEVSRVWKGYLLARENERITQKQLENMQQQLVVDVTNHYYEVLKSTNRLALAQNQLKIAQKECFHARVKDDAGMITRATLYGYQTKLAKAKSDLGTAQKELSESQTNLALLIGLSGDFKYQLVDEVAFKPAEFTSLTAVIAQALSPQNFSVWAAERLAAVTWQVTDHTDNYNVGVAEAHIKDLEASATKDEIKKKVQSLYWALQTMEETHHTLEQNKQAAQEKLRITKIQKEVGLTTELQVQQTEQTFKQAVDELKQLVYRHNVAEIQLQMITGEDLVSKIQIKEIG